MVVLQCQGAQPPPSRKSMNRISEERKELYMCHPPKGRRVPVLVRPGEVDGGVPRETYIGSTVRGLRGGVGRGSARYAGGRPKGVDLGGNTKVTIGKADMGKGGADNPSGVCERGI